ncbi:winged helix-turn-helix transcriptional regulator [Gorillibacterium sp. sgz5001074]|uniref:winged helix-turn-helix transcriptional regulator n=1 Tax=Gorillibacterium sp. sgz5001074 TaxID=3446695 RepID=UPI003F667E27
MPERDALTELREDAAFGSADPSMPELPEEAYCSITNRIVIVSPLPQRIHELIRGLTAACYDVMVFHHGEPQLLSRLQADLLIADCTQPLEGPASFEWLDSPELAGVSKLRLLPAGSPAASDAGALAWPSPFPKALAAVRKLSEAGRSSGAGLADGPSSPVDGTLRLNGLVLDLKRHTAALQGARLDLTKTEFELLRVLIEAEGSVQTRQELLDKVWGDEYFGGSNTVDVHVKTLRQKLNDDPKSPRYIVTVRGVGYRAADR